MKISPSHNSQHVHCLALCRPPLYLNLFELLDKDDQDDNALESYCGDPDEPVMSGSDDEFSDLELF